MIRARGRAVECDELLDHRGRRRRRDPLVLASAPIVTRPEFDLELVDALQVILDRLRQVVPVMGGRVTWSAVTIRVGHTADPDDAFMVWALEAGAVDTRGLELETVVSDIQTLNDWALEGRLEVTAISAAAYPDRRPLPLPAVRRVVRRRVRADRRGFPRALARRASRARDRHSRPVDDRVARASPRCSAGTT